jgi:hypothetical protein
MNHRYNAIRKCNRSGPPQDGREWYGYLIPKEILALNAFGVPIDPRDLKVAIHWKREGINNGRWTYFQATDEFEEIRRGQRMLGDQSDNH